MAEGPDDWFQYESCNNQTADALDAYQRAADLDPSNVHIKARLQLLRNNGQSTGMPNQHSAPAPRDVHPQLYQAAGVGAPPGPQWGAPGPASVPPGAGPTPSGPSSQDWSRHHLAEIQHPQPQPQPPNPYDRPRDPIRPPPPPRQISPRSEQMMQYRDQNRHTPVRRSTPPPTLNHMPPSSYSGPQGLPQPPPPASQAPAPNRISNPNYGAPNAGVAHAPSGGHGGPGLPPHGRGNSPPPEIRPLADDRGPSPGPSYSHHHYHHSTPSQTGGIAAGAPPPVAALAAAEAAAARERDDRPLTGFKRMHEPDDDYKVPHKIPANGDSRSRLENFHHRRASPDSKPSRGRPSPPRIRQASPPGRDRRGSSEARLEDQRRPDENYHPSEAAHHPQTLPSMLPQQPPPHEHLPAMGEHGRDNRRDFYEAASRDIDLEENYDSEAEEGKVSGGSGGRNSPQRNMMNGQTKVET